MLAIRAKPRGFEIEFTVPLTRDQQIAPQDFLIQQWRYLGTSGYGGPKLDLADLRIKDFKLSEDRKRLYLEISGLKKEHVIYFMIPEDLRGENNLPLWSNEAWYTLNNIPAGL